MTTKLGLLPEEKYFPLDLDSIFGVGVEQWQKEFFWPISWVDFLKLEDKICDLLDSYVKEHRSHFISDLILINYKIYIEYTNLIHEVIVINNLKLKKRLAISNNSHRNKQITENHIPKSSWIKIPEITKNHWLKNKIQNARLLYRLTSFHSFSNFFASKVYITDVSCSKLTIEYLKRRFPGRVRAKCFNEWLNASIKTPDNEKKEIGQFCRQIVGDVSKIAEEYSVFFNDKQLDYLFKSTATLFQTTYNLLLQVKDSLKKCQPIHLFIGPNNSFFSRILSVATRKTGGKVSAFKHGEPLAYNWKKIAWMELSLVDEYFEYSTQLAEVLKRTLKTNRR